ncbi:hypothetical protein [Candidatus Symbiopectobacterium sp. NZEC151]|uniref:hypothetical protein n=1 Tax=Candidatus Symbiopectobacterium sp. NZEC151 TaxID=2820470 RepID=UPI0022269542|nr:hypothetical protein [Candidatus Symbiopectobacterium sp. NZEC151]MCW2475367.1 hypothetical protein [Candidatus Symbiopectobacterium sp. NZEC151]
MIVKFKVSTTREEKKQSNHKDSAGAVIKFKPKSSVDEEKIIQSIIVRAEQMNW